VSEKLWASLWQTARVLSYSCACYCALAAVQCGVAMATGGQVGVASPPPAPKVNLAEVSTQLLISLALLVAIGFFSLSESAITTLWPWKVRELADKEGDGGPFKVLQKDITRFLTTILIGSTVSGIAATALVTDAAFKIAGEVGVGYATVALTFGMLIFCEIAPKSIAVIHAAPIARFVIPSISVLGIILYPIGVISKKITAVILMILRIDASTEPFVTEEELKLVLNGAAKSGAVLEKESEMIARVLGLEDTPVREIMTPLVEVVAVEETSTLDHMREIWRKHQYSRVPVFRGRIDNVVGIMYCYDMLQFTEQEKLEEVLVGQMAQRPPFFVPENMSVWNLLKEFRLRKSHMAVVVNEYGGTIGICTMEDAVEEIVGDIYDENDKYITKQNIVPRGNGIFDVDAKTELDELREVMKLDFTEGPYETVSGYVMAQFGCIPEVFQSMEVTLTPLKKEYEEEKEGGEDWGNSGNSQEAQKVLMRLTVTEGTNRQIHSVRLEQLSKDGLPVVGDPPPPPITAPYQQLLPLPSSDVETETKTETETLVSGSSAPSADWAGLGPLPLSSMSVGDDAPKDGDQSNSSLTSGKPTSVGDDAAINGDLSKSSPHGDLSKPHWAD